jgi:ketosteroid isomerase-like protein
VPKIAASAGAALPASATEPVAVVDEFFRALASGDTVRVTRLLDPAVLIYESGGAERSRGEYTSHHLGGDVAFLKTARHRLLSRTGNTLGDLAWVASESQLSSSSKGKPVNLVSTETMVLRKTSEGWRIVHIHWSSRRLKDGA